MANYRMIMKRGSKDLERIVIDAFKEYHDFFVYQVVERLSRSSFCSEATDNSVLKEQKPNEWIAIDSLSKLRQNVGGRFQTLKARWLDAGFPLKAKKGDKIPEYEVNEKGWIELQRWISKQGYEARRREGESEILFEIRRS